MSLILDVANNKKTHIFKYDQVLFILSYQQYIDHMRKNVEQNFKKIRREKENSNNLIYSRVHVYRWLCWSCLEKGM